MWMYILFVCMWHTHNSYHIHARWGVGLQYVYLYMRTSPLRKWIINVMTSAVVLDDSGLLCISKDEHKIVPCAVFRLLLIRNTCIHISSWHHPFFKDNHFDVYYDGNPLVFIKHLSLASSVFSSNPVSKSSFTLPSKYARFITSAARVSKYWINLYDSPVKIVID